MECKISMLPGEYWYGLAAGHGPLFPLHKDSAYSYHPTKTYSENQESSILLSTKGRYLWSTSAYDVDVENGVISISNAADDFALYEGYETLRGAYLAAVQAHFPPSGMIPPEAFFIKPQYNTWAELIYDQTQESILHYAHGIIDNDLPAGILMVDDGWMQYYGGWRFRLDTFPDAAGMLKELRELGFDVMLWIAPFVSPDSPEFRELNEKKYLVREADGSVAIRHWWNGHSAVLDLSNPGACKWLDDQLKPLMDMGVTGFKFDAGDVHYYRDNDITYGNVSAHEQCKLWAMLGTKYRFNEYRACYQCAGQPLVQRLADKPHHWGAMPSLVSNSLLNGLLGNAYVCPDMIGGGSFVDFLPGAPNLKPEIFVRYAQAAALMPMMQYSAAPWRVLPAEHAELCRAAGRLHLKYSEKIIALAYEASRTGEPIMRHMDYVFPGQGYEVITDQFMLGNDILVAPVLTESTYTRKVHLPEGQWEYPDGTIYQGGGEIEVPAPLDTLPFFIKR